MQQFPDLAGSCQSWHIPVVPAFGRQRQASQDCCRHPSNKETRTAGQLFSDYYITSSISVRIILHNYRSTDFSSSKHTGSISDSLDDLCIADTRGPFLIMILIIQTCVITHIKIFKEFNLETFSSLSSNLKFPPCRSPYSMVVIFTVLCFTLISYHECFSKISFRHCVWRYV